MGKQENNTGVAPYLSDQEIEGAMEQAGGFIDISPEDFRKVYEIAWGVAKQHPPVKKAQPAEDQPWGFWKKVFKPISESGPRVSVKEVVLSWFGAFLGIAGVSLIHYRFLQGSDLVMLIGSFGASAVLIYGAIKSPLAQPRNLVGGHFVSAFTGVVMWKLFSFEPWLAAALAVSTAIALMHLTKTLHPPGGATALIAVIGSPAIHDLGFLYPFVPALTGATVMLVIALVSNNIFKSRKYPEYWF